MGTGDFSKENRNRKRKKKASQQAGRLRQGFWQKYDSTKEDGDFFQNLKGLTLPGD